jgi:hypothetical protein
MKFDNNLKNYFGNNLFYRLEQIRAAGSRPQRFQGQCREGHLAEEHRKKYDR